MPNDMGKVYLVGAGPGDGGLLTVKAVEVLEKADVVVYDRLVSDDILLKIPPAAEKIDVGKNAGHHPIPQGSINQILLDKALENKVVVRLKGGDPFLFGRGGEELELLCENQIPFEVVPGITSAIAAAAYAGIPVTHREFCSSLHIITGHAKSDGALDIAYDSLVKLNGTLVFLMSVSSVGEIADGLLKAGMDPDTNAAVIENGTRGSQRKFVSRLDAIASVITQNNVKSPATIIVGKVCTLSEQFDWFSALPLKGCKVLVTRPKQAAGKFSGLLRALGAEVTEYPCIQTAPVDFPLELAPLQWLVFTSAAGVKAFFEKLLEKELDGRALYGKKIAVVGTETANALFKQGIRADFIPSVFDGKHLAAELLQSGQLLEKQNVGIFRAKVGGEDLVRILQDSGVNVSDVAVYETRYIKNNCIDVRSFDYAAFTSASCVHGFAGCFESASGFENINAVCIGQQTADAARSYGMNVIISDKATIEGMTEKLREVYHAKQTP